MGKYRIRLMGDTTHPATSLNTYTREEAEALLASPSKLWWEIHQHFSGVLKNCPLLTFDAQAVREFHSGGPILAELVEVCDAQND